MAIPQKFFTLAKNFVIIVFGRWDESLVILIFDISNSGEII